MGWGNGTPHHLLGKYSIWECHNPLSVLTPPCTTFIISTPLQPYSPVLAVPSLISTHIYLFSLTFSPRPDEAATVWWV